MGSRSVVSDSLRPHGLQPTAPPSMGFSRHEFWSGVPLPGLSHSGVFLYVFALMAEEGFLISSCYSLELCIQMFKFSFSTLLFMSLLFTAIWKASPDSHFAFLHFFSMGMVLIPVSYTTTAKSLRSCPTLCDTRDGSPPGSLVPGILEARILESVAISFSSA